MMHGLKNHIHKGCTMNKQEIIKLENYLVNQFGADIKLKPSKNDDCTEVLLNGEFIGTVYKDEEDGEISYTLTMSILDIDLE